MVHHHYPHERTSLLVCLLFSCSLNLIAQTGKVGINTNTPSAMLHVKDSSVLFAGPAILPGTPGAPPVSGAGIRMMWYADKAAFRAGRASITEWDRDSVGVYSSALGWKVQAKGQSSFVGGGEDNDAAGLRSFIGGGSFNSTTGTGSFVGGGTVNTASGTSSFVAAGGSNMATASFSFIGGGTDNTASGSRSFVGGGSFGTAAESGSYVGGGIGNSALSLYDFVGGGADNTASGSSAFVGGGTDNTASGWRAFVGGGSNGEASGNRSVVLGGAFNATSGVSACIAGGEFHMAAGNNSFIGGGISLEAPSFSESVFGSYCTTYSAASPTGFNSNDRLFVVGNGTSTSSRSNALTILKNGRTGIGTDNPLFQLHVGDGTLSPLNGSNTRMVVTDNDNSQRAAMIGLARTSGGIRVEAQMEANGSSNSGPSVILGAASSHPLYIRTGNITRMTIDDAGNVGIGTQIPAYRLQVSTNSAAKPTSNTWTVASDARLKRNVHAYTDGLDALLQVRPVWFTYTGAAGLPEDTGVGVIAQELQEVAPYMIGTWTHESGGQETDYLSVDNGAMTYMLINAVKEQQAIIEELTHAVGALSEELADIRARFQTPR